MIYSEKVTEYLKSKNIPGYIKTVYDGRYKIQIIDLRCKLKVIILQKPKQVDIDNTIKELNNNINKEPFSNLTPDYVFGACTVRENYGSMDRYLEIINR